MADPVYQFAATAKECELFRTIRNLERSLSAEAQTKLNQTLNLTLTDSNGEFFGSTEIDAQDLVWEFVRAALGFYSELIEDKPQPPNEPAEVDEDDHNDDCDSVLGSQSQVASDDLPNEDVDEKNIMSWDVIRDSIIPPCVKEVTFTIGRDYLTTSSQEDLQSQFPGVVIVAESTDVEELAFQKDTMEEKPKGVKRMIIELDESEVAQDPKLDSVMRERFPWALIDSKPGPNTSRKRARHAAGTDTAVRRADPLKHLEDFAEYAAGPPLDYEFGYKYIISENWEELSYPKKLEIAHARAIQHHHGKPADGPGCSHCVENNYQCKIYLPQLANLSHITFGHSCQNCRLQSISCDLPAAKRERTPQAPITRPTGLTLDTQNLSVDSPIDDDTPAPSTAATPKPSLLSQTPQSNSATTPAITLATDTQAQEEERLDLDTRKSIRDSNMRMEAIVEKIGLRLHENKRAALRVIESIHHQWRTKGIVKPFEPPNWNACRVYYGYMTAIYILAYAKMDMSLTYIILLRMQSAIFSKPSAIPPVETATQAFEYLPYDSPLCQWIATLYAFRWDTLSAGDYKDSAERHNPAALSKLLYAVMAIRYPYTEGMGSDEPILERWCKVHDHVNYSEDLCQRTRNDASEVRNFSRLGKHKLDASSPRGGFKKNKRAGGFGLGRPPP